MAKGSDSATTALFTVLTVNKFYVTAYHYPTGDKQIIKKQLEAFAKEGAKGINTE